MTSAALAHLLSDIKALHPEKIDLSLDRVRSLLQKLGNPHDKLPPVFHVAGTNGKGSTVAFLRACLEASGRRVHVYTSPHLVAFNERFRIAGTLATDEQLMSLLSDVVEVNAGAPITFFELITAAAFTAFARHPADACVLEVGLGGRLDATNVVAAPAVCGVAQIGLDHQAFLGEHILDIAGEKAGIAKTDVPLIVSRYPKTVTQRVAEVAGLAGAPVVLRGTDWDIASYEGELHYKDRFGKVTLPHPRLVGAHQVDNAGLAVSMLRHQRAIHVADAALRAGMGWAEWPARLHRMDHGPLFKRLPTTVEVWLDGGHNPLAARILADCFRAHNLADRPFYMIVGMTDTKDSAGFMKPFANRATALYAVPIADHQCHSPEALADAAKAVGIPAQTASSLEAAITTIANGLDKARPPVILITGSLYLAGEALAKNGWVPG